MIITIFSIFLLLYLFFPFKDKYIFKKNGWLYFISHYQIFAFGLLSMIFMLFSFVCKLTYSIFFNDSSPFIYAFFLMFFILPFSLDSISYGLFGTSFFLDNRPFKRRGNIPQKKLSFFFSFFNLYVRWIYVLLSMFFFVISYCFLLCFYVFFCWSLINKKESNFILHFIFENNIFYIFCFLVFLFPCFLECFYYGFKSTSYFKNYKDF